MTRSEGIYMGTEMQQRSLPKAESKVQFTGGMMLLKLGAAPLNEIVQ